MLMDQLLKKVKAALADRAEWQIYDAYDPTPFDKRPDWFLTVGISGTEKVFLATCDEENTLSVYLRVRDRKDMDIFT